MRGYPPFKGEGGSVGKHRRGGSKRENAVSGIAVGDGGRVDEGEFLGPVEWVWGYRGDFAKDKFPNLLWDVRDIYGHNLSLIDQSRMFRPVRVVSKVILTSVTADFERDVMRL
jgi:hypothetical protein